VTIRAALLTVLYQHVLVLEQQQQPRQAPQLANSKTNKSNADKDSTDTATPPPPNNWTVGQINTLIAVDTHKLYEVVQEGHLIWALPLAILLVSIALWTIWGPVTLTGMGVLVALVPLVQQITTTMHRFRTQRVALTDQRIECTNTYLQSVRVAKVNHYEPAYYDKIMSFRQQEVHWLQKETAVWATTLSVSKLSASCAAAATFTVYVFLDVENHIITAASSFAVFLLLAALRFPINYAGRFMGRVAQAKSSLHRIALFLHQNTRPWPDHNDTDEKEEKCKEENNYDNSHKDKDQSSSVVTTPDKRRQPSLKVRQGSFAVGSNDAGTISHHSSQLLDLEDGNDRPNHPEKDNDPKKDLQKQQSPQSISIRPLSHQRSSFVVRGLDVSVHQGEVVACCGPVGSGKSTFIKGIIGDAAPVLAGTQVHIQGTLAVVPQTPFILNATLRDNILFGRPYNPALYRRVIAACCLEPDIANLGSTGDLTEIGERGVTLSG
jgi:ABC-type multidrug transport system fused ATPase/permease subunit